MFATADRHSRLRVTAEDRAPTQRWGTFDLAISCEATRPVTTVLAFDRAATAAADWLHWIKSHDCEIDSSNEQFNDWVNRSRTDLHMMILALIESIWPNIELALHWIDTYGDGDGFVEYARHSPMGLIHQGWKDSKDGVFHPSFLEEVRITNHPVREGSVALLIRRHAQGVSVDIERREGKVEILTVI